MCNSHGPVGAAHVPPAPTKLAGPWNQQRSRLVQNIHSNKLNKGKTNSKKIQPKIVYHRAIQGRQNRRSLKGPPGSTPAGSQCLKWGTQSKHGAPEPLAAWHAVGFPLGQLLYCTEMGTLLSHMPLSAKSSTAQHPIREKDPAVSKTSPVTFTHMPRQHPKTVLVVLFGQQSIGNCISIQVIQMQPPTINPAGQCSTLAPQN